MFISLMITFASCKHFAQKQKCEFWFNFIYLFIFLPDYKAKNSSCSLGHRRNLTLGFKREKEKELALIKVISRSKRKTVVSSGVGQTPSTTERLNLEPEPPVRIPSCVSAQLRLMGGSQVNPGCSEELSVSQLAWGGPNKPVGPMEVLLNLSALTRLPLGYPSLLSQRRRVDKLISTLETCVSEKLTSNDPNAAKANTVSLAKRVLISQSKLLISKGLSNKQ